LIFLLKISVANVRIFKQKGKHAGDYAHSLHPGTIATCHYCLDY